MLLIYEGILTVPQCGLVFVKICDRTLYCAHYIIYLLENTFPHLQKHDAGNDVTQ